MINYKEIQDQLNGLWPDIMQMYGIDVGNFKGLNTSNTPCPLCGGNDRAHWREQQGRIALFCRNCAPDSMKSPESVILELTGIKFDELVKNLSDYINHVPLESIKKAKIKSIARPLVNMPVDHKQDHELVEKFLKGCEWCHSIRLLSKNAANPQKLPSKNNIDYWPVYNKNGVMINMIKYVDEQPVFLAGGPSYGALYQIKGGKRRIVVTNPIDGILCWYKTKATIFIVFTPENLRYCLSMNKQLKAVVCVREKEEYSEYKEDDHDVRLLTGDPYGEFKINI